jgi:hypothetical protein
LQDQLQSSLAQLWCTPRRFSEEVMETLVII